MTDHISIDSEAIHTPLAAMSESPITVATSPSPSAQDQGFDTAPATPTASPPSRNVAIDPETSRKRRRDEENDQALDDAIVDSMSTMRAVRPKSTTSTYAKPQRLWKQWCDQKEWRDTDLVSQAKLLLFIKEVVLKEMVDRKGNSRRTASVKRQKTESLEPEELERAEILADVADATIVKNLDADQAETLHAQALFDDGVEAYIEGDTRTPLQNNSVRGYVSAVMDLYNEQVTLGRNTNPSPRGIGVKAQLAALRAQRWERTRALHEDRAVGTILDSFTPAELTDFASFCWEKHNGHYRSSEQYLRTLTDFLTGHYFLTRGEHRLKADFADCVCIDLFREGTQRCICWLFIFDNGKTNKTGRKQYLGSMRHKDLNICAHSALANYLFNRFHVQNEAWPDFRRLKDWDDLKLLRGDDPKKPLNRSTQRLWIQKVYDGIGFTGTKKAHMGRPSGAQWAEILGVGEQQVSFVIVVPKQKVCLSLSRIKTSINNEFLLEPVFSCFRCFRCCLVEV